MSASTSSKEQSKPSPPRPPSLLQPPATVISPPSPTDAKNFHPPTFTFPPQPATTDGPDDVVEYDSPEEDEEVNIPTPPTRRPNPRPRPSYQSLSPAPQAHISSQLFESPRKESTFLFPDSPDLSAPTSRPASPSSPRYRPKGLHHRRTSSTHRVRETTDGTQTSSDDGARMINQYRIGRSLGKGAYAKVELGVDVGTGEEYAIKEFSKSRLHYQALQDKQRQNSRGRIRRAQGPSGLPSGQTAISRAGEEQSADQGARNQPWGGTKTIDEDPLGLIRREVAIMKKLDHPNIVHLYEAISVSKADALFLVLEYLPGGTLMEIHVGKDDSNAKPPFSLYQTREYFRQLCLGLEYLHENGVIHRDIKPDNVLLSSNRELVKLCDFGVSEMFTAAGDDRVKKSGGSPAFLSPESFTAHQQDLHGKAVDIWALGVTLYCMLTGKLPFNVPTPMELFTAVREKEPILPNEWDESQKDLMKRMLDKDPKRRISMADIREHPWVTDHGEEPMIETEANLFDIGKQVEEPTQEELRNAIGKLRSIFTVVRAVQKMRRLQLQRLATSGKGPPSPGGSTNASLASGSMDSYVSQGQGTAATSVSDDTEDPKYRDIAGETVMSPRSMSRASLASTERQSSNKTEKLTPLDTKLDKQAEKPDDDEEQQGEKEREEEKKGEDGDDGEDQVVLVDSPTSSDNEIQKTPV